VRVKALLIACGALVASAAVSPQAQPADGVGKAVLWRDPGAIEQRDVFWGMADESRKPSPPFAFVSEKLTGTTAKVVITDSKGRGWDVKFGSEAHAEVAASRLVWALGYLTQEMYYVGGGAIEGAKDLQRAQKHIQPDGRFREARFRVRDPNITETGNWAFDRNPFVGTQELSGLILLMAVISNWDTADVNNKEIHLVTSANGSREQWYTIPDLGASFGRFVGPQGTPIKWFLKSFQQDKLVQRVDGTSVHIDYQAFGHPPRMVPLEHARWFATLAGRLQESQIRRAFDASGATPEEGVGYTAKILEKIGELRSAVTASR
jgi:hypothetical protein